MRASYKPIDEKSLGDAKSAAPYAVKTDYAKERRELVKWLIEKGITEFVVIATENACETCLSHTGKVYTIDEVDKAMPPYHPNCKCVMTAYGGKKKEEDAEKTFLEKADAFLTQLNDYLERSLEQIIMGSFTENVTLLGTAGEIAFGIIGLDLPMDARDFYYDITHWEWTLEHFGKTALDVAAVLPLIGALKYSDEVSTLIKRAEGIAEKAGVLKRSDDLGDIADALKRTDDLAEDAVKSGGELLNSAGNRLRIIDGKVGGKIPMDDYNAIRSSSIKNANADSITLGKYTNDANSYIVKAGSDSSYFDMGNEWRTVQKKYGLTSSEMFEYFNLPVLDDAIFGGKTIRFSHNPASLEDGGFLQMEWDYIKAILGLTDENLIKIGDFWYVK